MGTVSTALTEEALTESLKRDFYQSAPTDDAADSCEENKDDIKCSICQVFSSHLLKLYFRMSRDSLYSTRVRIL